MSRSFKKHEYTGSKRFDKSCRCHGGCPHCEGSKLLYKKIGEDLLKVNLQEVEVTEFKRMYIDDISDIPRNMKACPAQVKIDLTDAKRKIKMKLKMLR